ncbi:MAG: PaaI family thioesterase [Vicinamibacterales bacterium]
MSDTPLPTPTETRTAMTGLEYFERMAAGEIPLPEFVKLAGLRIEEVAFGRIVFIGAAEPRYYNGLTVAHGGWTATLLDSALACAVNTAQPAGRVFTTLELKINYTRPITTEVGPVRCEARVLHVGSRTATAEARVTDAAGKLYAHATTTCIVM